MKNIKDIMQNILTGIENGLPPILQGYGLENFAGYSMGFNVDPKKNLLCVRVHNTETDNLTVTFNFIIEAQLPGVKEIEAYEYADAVNEYLKGFDPQAAGFTAASCSFEFSDDIRTAAVVITWRVTLTGQKDDCDY